MCSLLAAFFLDNLFHNGEPWLIWLLQNSEVILFDLKNCALLAMTLERTRELCSGKYVFFAHERTMTEDWQFQGTGYVLYLWQSLSQDITFLCFRIVLTLFFTIVDTELVSLSAIENAVRTGQPLSQLKFTLVYYVNTVGRLTFIIDGLAASEFNWVEI